MKVFVTRRIPDAGLRLLRRRHTVRVHPGSRAVPRRALIKGVRWADALLCLLTDRIDAAVLDANPDLRVVANYAVGYDNIDLAAARTRGIPVTNTPGVLTDATAEHAIALMMAIARRIPESDGYMRAGRYHGWDPLLLLGMELTGKTVGVVGAGRIGTGVAKRAAALGMRVVYSDPNRNARIDRRGGRRVALQRLLKASDIVTLHAPLNPSTRHLIGARQLRLMKRSALLVNTARGPLIDERALVRALQSRRIAGAALDVFESEPKLAPGLTRLSNVVLSPHTASATVEARSAMAEMAARNVLAALAGRRPPNLVRG